MITLRDYQRACLKTIAERRVGGIYKPLVALPTGTGKTVIFVFMIKANHGKSLVLVHRDELLRQAEDKLLTVWPEAQVGVVKAKRNELDAPVTIASVQSLSRKNRLAMAKDIDYSLIVTDEAHHSVAPTYVRIYESLWRDDGTQTHLGVTATPNRADQVGLQKVFDEVVYHKTLLDMIVDGWLCDLRCTVVHTNAFLGNVKTRRGDFAVGELANVVNTANRNELIVRAYQEHAAGRMALCFTVDVVHAVSLAKKFKEQGIKAESLSAKTPVKERRRLLQRFHGREVDVLCNCMILTEGFDEPALDCIIMARPTKSTTLFTQMIGRGTRVFPGKQDCLILDLADVAGRHKVAQLPDLVGLKKEYELDGKKTITQLVGLEKREMARMIMGRGISSSDVNLFMGSELAWVSANDRYYLSLGRHGSIRVVPVKSRSGKYAILHFPKGGESRFLSPRPIDLSWALGIADAQAEEITGGELILARKDAEWRNLPMTVNQQRILREKHVEFDPNMTRGQATDLIGMVFAGGADAKSVTDLLKSKSGEQLTFLDVLSGKASAGRR